MADKLFVYTDGGARGNPGPAAVGVVLKTETGKILNKICRTIGQTTNNVAEYKAVIEALNWIKNNQLLIVGFAANSAEIKIQFFLDSKLVVNQLNGLFKIKDANLRNLLVEIRQLEQEVGGNISYFLIPREKNWQADLLVNQALDGS